mmetsp:Transcript_21685/g.63754  ORF Transcript_21685/g.63754 Transcript_21685/m.63754 type:complete len:277 (-) Transcript_21685:303-1133(-)
MRIPPPPPGNVVDLQAGIGGGGIQRGRGGNTRHGTVERTRNSSVHTSDTRIVGARQDLRRGSHPPHARSEGERLRRPGGTRPPDQRQPWEGRRYRRRGSFVRRKNPRHRDERPSRPERDRIGSRRPPGDGTRGRGARGRRDVPRSRPGPGVAVPRRSPRRGGGIRRRERIVGRPRPGGRRRRHGDSIRDDDRIDIGAFRQGGRGRSERRRRIDRGRYGVREELRRHSREGHENSRGGEIERLPRLVSGRGASGVPGGGGDGDASVEGPAGSTDAVG